MLAETVPLLVLPDGAPRTRRWKVFLAATVCLVGGLVVASACAGAVAAVGTPQALLGGASAPSGGAAEVAGGLSAFGWLAAHAAAMVALIGLLVARRRTTGAERRVYSTVLVGAALAVGVLVATSLVEPLSGGRLVVPEAFSALIWGLAIPVSVAVAILRFAMFEIRTFISRTVLFAVTLSALVGAYLLVLWAMTSISGTPFEASPASVAAAALVGITTAFVSTRSRAIASRWFGRATDIGQLARRYDTPDSGPGDESPDLHRLAATVKDELRLGSVELRLADVAAVRVGDAGGPTKLVPLFRGRQNTGEMIVTARPGEALSRHDEKLLDDIARYVALAAEVISVNEQLLESQQALEAAQAEERRRLRRDLHDGLGPALAAIRLNLVARARALSDDRELSDAADAVSDAIREVRRIVDGLQPSVLEDLGLVAALQMLVADSSASSGIDIELEASGNLEDLSPTVATTAYRMTAEAVANVVRHSSASRCRVEAQLADGALALKVTDDGRGFDTDHSVGVGLGSIQTRASNAGGSARIDSQVGRGTIVTARLPLVGAP
jgi:signal transduction histidine kinase